MIIIYYDNYEFGKILSKSYSYICDIRHGGCAVVCLRVASFCLVRPPLSLIFNAWISNINIEYSSYIYIYLFWKVSSLKYRSLIYIHIYSIYSYMDMLERYWHSHSVSYKYVHVIMWVNSKWSYAITSLGHKSSSAQLTSHGRVWPKQSFVCFRFLVLGRWTLSTAISCDLQASAAASTWGSLVPWSFRPARDPPASSVTVSTTSNVPIGTGSNLPTGCPPAATPCPHPPPTSSLPPHNS